jgi:hypothetical protein
MTTALDGNVPPEKGGAAGPASTSESIGPPVTPATGTPVTLVPGGKPFTPNSTSTTTAPIGGTSPVTTTTSPTATTTTTTAAPPTSSTTTTTTTTAPPDYRSQGVVDGTTVTLGVESSTAVPGGTGTHVATLSDFVSTDPSFACLESAGALEVWSYAGSSEDWVLARTADGDCMTATFSFAASDVPTTGSGSVSTTGSAGSGAGTTASSGAAGATADKP